MRRLDAAGSENTIDYRRHIDRTVLEVTGSIPLGAQSATRTVAVVNPTVFFAQSLKDGLVARGIPVAGQAVDFDDIAAEMPGGSVRVLATTPSPPLREIATVLMKVSQNLYAETLLKALGAARNGLGTAEGGRIAIRNTLAAWGIPRDAHVVYDGSGLSRYNYVTASTLSAVLERMYKRSPASRSVRRHTAHRRKRRLDRIADAPHARGGERGREDRIDRQRPIAVRVCEDP